MTTGGKKVIWGCLVVVVGIIGSNGLLVVVTGANVGMIIGLAVVAGPLVVVVVNIGNIVPICGLVVVVNTPAVGIGGLVVTTPAVGNPGLDVVIIGTLGKVVVVALVIIGTVICEFSIGS